MLLIVGLGNPGERYARTRHNIGFRCLERFADRHGFVFGPVRRGCRAAPGRLAGRDLVLLEPLRYMNRSGEALATWAEGVDGLDLASPSGPEGLRPLAIVDDIALPLGGLRLRAKGSDGGHNGLASLARALGTEAFPRLRLGVGPTDADVDPAVWKDYVLEDFDEREWPLSEDLIETGCEALEAWIVEGLERAASRFNRRGPAGAPDPT